jgi:alpha-L-rhamnosidase
MGGPIFGASGKINLAYYDALRSMSKMCSSADAKDTFSSQADHLKESIISHLWNGDAGIMRMSDTVSPTGICQDINAYGVTTGISPFHSKSASFLTAPKDSQLPLAFQGIERWDQKKSSQSLRIRVCSRSSVRAQSRVISHRAHRTCVGSHGR